jgi:hypothetical protein
MICPECNNKMIDEYEGVGNGKLMDYGNFYSDEPTKKLPVYYCKLCHLMIVQHGDEEE